MLYKVALSVSIQMKVTEQFFPMVLFAIMLYKIAVLNQSVDI